MSQDGADTLEASMLFERGLNYSKRVLRIIEFYISLKLEHEPVRK